MSKVGDRRLMKVVVALKDAAKVPVLVRSFSMSKWGRKFSDFCGYLEAGDDVIYAKACGTPACAMGHYAARQDLQRTFAIDSDGDLCTRKKGYNAYRTGENTMSEDHDIEKHFFINNDQFEELFGGRGCNNANTPKDAAAYIENFVRMRS